MTWPLPIEGMNQLLIMMDFMKTNALATHGEYDEIPSHLEHIWKHSYFRGKVNAILIGEIQFNRLKPP